MGRFMNAKDALSAPLAAINLTAEIKKTKSELPILGKQAKETAPRAGKARERLPFTIIHLFSDVFSRHTRKRERIFISISR